MSPSNPAYRYSQWDHPIPITSFEEVENRSCYNTSYNLTQEPLQSRSKKAISLVSPLGSTGDYSTFSASDLSLECSAPREFSSGASGESAPSGISELTSQPREPRATSRRLQSDSEGLPTSPSISKEASRSVSPESRQSHTPQPDWSEKEAIGTGVHDSPYFSLSRSPTSYFSDLPPAYPSTSDLGLTLHDSGFGQPLAYSQSLAYNQALGVTSNNPDMHMFRRNPSKALRGNQGQASLPPSTGEQQHPRASVSSTFDEKRSLGPQDTGITHADGEVGFGYGVQDEEKQSLSQNPLSITAQISEARSTRVRAVVDAYVEPILREQAANGLARSTLVLVPEVAINPDSATDFSSLTNASSSEKDVKSLPSDTCRLLSSQEAHDLLIGFPAEQTVRVVRLSPAHSGHTGHSGSDRDRLGDEGSRFWQQAAVVAELDRLLRIRLVGMGLDVQDATGATAPYRRAGWTGRGEMVGPGLPAASEVAKLKNKNNNNENATKNAWSGDHWDAGVGIWSDSGIGREKSSWQQQKEAVLLSGQASVRVELQDVSFRTVSAMGLYETRLDQAVVVTVAIEV